MYNGILNVYKPVGMTSFDVVSVIRRLTGTRKIGHTGTLDPGAEGVLTVCVGEALKCVEYMMEKDKEYIAEITFGSATDTQDGAGNIIETSDKRISEDELKDVVSIFQGKQMQKPPLYSALKINGKKYCDIARQGLDIEAPAEREITVYSINLLGARTDENGLVSRAEIFIHCSKGTYIRTICNDIGERAASCAHMSRLKRVRAGAFTEDNSYTLDKLNEMSEAGCLKDAFLPLELAFLDLKSFVFDDGNIKRFINGIPIKLYLLDGLEHVCDVGELIKIYDAGGMFRAVGRVVKDGKGKTIKSYRIFNLNIGDKNDSD